MTPEQAQESAWIQQVLAGRTEAFQALVERYFGTVRLVALAKTGNTADADDVAQETFTKAYETLGVLRNRERLAPWLVAIARNLAISVVRRRERERRAAESHSVDPRVYPDHERRESLDAVARQVERLPENLREVVLLHYFEGLKCREIAERLDLSTAAVLKRLSRGRDLLGDRLLREWGEDGRREASKPGVSRVMGAIVALPRPDWSAQLAGTGGAGAGAVLKAWIGPPVALKVASLASAMVLVALFFALGRREDGLTPGENITASNIPKARALLPEVNVQPDRVMADAAVSLPDPNVLPVLVPAGFVAGVVMDRDGGPIGGATISVIGNGASGRGASASNGNFRIELASSQSVEIAQLTAQKLNLECIMEGYSPVVQSDIMPGDTAIQVVMERPALIAGKVVDATNGQPVPEFSFHVGTFPLQEFHSGDGKFSLEGNLGFDVVSVIAPGYVATDVDFRLQRGYAEEGLLIEMQPGSEIHGVVVDAATQKPVEKARVKVQFEHQPEAGGGQVFADEKGSFTIGELPPDTEIGLLATAPKYAPKGLHVIAANDGETITIRLGQGGSVRGRLLYDGKPPEQVDITKRVFPSREELEIGQPYPAQPSNEATIYLGHLEFGTASMLKVGGSDYEIGMLAEGPYIALAERGTLQMYAFTEIVEGQVTTLDFDFATNSGYAAVHVAGVRDPTSVQFEMCDSEDPAVIVSARGEGIYTRLRVGNHLIGYPGVAPGDYVIRAFLPDRSEAAAERRVAIRGGQVTEVYFDLAGAKDSEVSSDADEAHLP